MELTRSIYVRDRGAVGSCPPPSSPIKWEGKEKRDREMGAGLKELEKKPSGNNLWRKTYFSNYDIGMQNNTI